MNNLAYARARFAARKLGLDEEEINRDREAFEVPYDDAEMLWVGFIKEEVYLITMGEDEPIDHKDLFAICIFMQQICREVSP